MKNYIKLSVDKGEIIKKLKNKNHYFPGIKEVMYTTNLINKIF